jgi:hypothetical protein
MRLISWTLQSGSEQKQFTGSRNVHCFIAFYEEPSSTVIDSDIQIPKDTVLSSLVFITSNGPARPIFHRRNIADVLFAFSLEGPAVRIL